MFYNQDHKSNLRTASKLTQLHVFLGAFKKTKVFLGAQVFSQNVICGKETYLASNKVDSSSKATVQFIDDMDKLFN